MNSLLPESFCETYLYTSRLFHQLLPHTIDSFVACLNVISMILSCTQVEVTPGRNLNINGALLPEQEEQLVSMLKEHQ